MAARVLADGLAFPEGPVVRPDGSIIVSEMAAGRLTRIHPDGTTSLVASVGGGPNGACDLGDGRMVVCRNSGATWGRGPWPRPDPAAVEVHRPVGPPADPVADAVVVVSGLDGDPEEVRVETLAESFVALDGTEQPLRRPSDVCPDGEGGFWMTDGGAVRGRVRDVTGVLHWTPDGPLREVVFPLEMPNGIALSPDGGRLIVAETRTRRIWSFRVDGPGRVGAADTLATVPAGGPLGFGGADGLCIDPDDRVVVATLGTGGYTVIDPDGRVVGAMALDDVLTTNVALGPDPGDLVVTLASTGRVVVVGEWLAAAGVAR